MLQTATNTMGANYIVKAKVPCSLEKMFGPAPMTGTLTLPWTRDPASDGRAAQASALVLAAKLEAWRVRSHHAQWLRMRST